MTRPADARPVEIPWEPCRWKTAIYVGKEVEFALVGVVGGVRRLFASEFMQRLARKVRGRPRCPDADERDFFAGYLGRWYQEMGEFFEAAGPTCVSGETVSRVFEETMELLSDVVLEASGRPVVLACTPTDYKDFASQGAASPSSTGMHLCVLSPRALDAQELVAFADLLAPLNAVFGPGGLAFSRGVPHWCDDPRARHVKLVSAGCAYGESPKPIFLLRNEHFAPTPSYRVQVTGFGNPRSPVVSWIQTDLVSLALRATLAGKTFPWRSEDPVATLRAEPHAMIRVRRGRPGRATSKRKTDIAADTVAWLTGDFGEECVEAESIPRIRLLRTLSMRALTANSEPGEPPVFPTDISVKKLLFDEVARMHGFDGFHALARARSDGTSPDHTNKTLEAMIVADVLFSSPSREHSTYEAACRAGLFVRPEFEQPVGPRDPAQIPPGICPRDRLRAELLAADEVLHCDWDEIRFRDGSTARLPAPWTTDLDRRQAAFDSDVAIARLLHEMEIRFRQQLPPSANHFRRRLP